MTSVSSCNHLGTKVYFLGQKQMLRTVNFKRIYALVRSEYCNKLKEQEKADLVSCIWILIARWNDTCRTLLKTFRVRKNNVNLQQIPLLI